MEETTALMSKVSKILPSVEWPLPSFVPHQNTESSNFPPCSSFDHGPHIGKSVSISFTQILPEISPVEEGIFRSSIMTFETA